MCTDTPNTCLRIMSSGLRKEIRHGRCTHSATARPDRTLATLAWFRGAVALKTREVGQKCLASRVYSMTTGQPVMQGEIVTSSLRKFNSLSDSSISI